MNKIPNFISIKEFADILNASTSSPIGETAIYQMIKTSGFPALMIGNRYMILIDKVQDWMESQFTQSTPCEKESRGEQP